MRLGKRIYNIRKLHGLTQEEFANIFSVTRQAVSNWENDVEDFEEDDLLRPLF